MNSEINSKDNPLVSSAIKWGLLHVGLAIVVSILFRLLIEFLFVILSFHPAIVGIIGSLLSAVVEYGFSFALMYFGMKEYREKHAKTSFLLSDALKWVAIVIALYVLIFGVFSILQTAFTFGVLNLEIGNEIVGLVIVPVVIWVTISAFVFFLEGIVVGVMLKTL